jgi:hypothetical protein
MRRAISIFEKAHPNCQALFIFDQSSAHASLGPDALHAFDMNKTNGGKQRIQKDTVIPMNNPTVERQGQAQKMRMDNGDAKGLEQTLKERGFNVDKMRAKCKPVCPSTNERCCMARLLSHQDDFWNQISMLEELITGASHLCIFLPKFHCELNPIEMVRFIPDSDRFLYRSYSDLSLSFYGSIGAMLNTAIARKSSPTLILRRKRR